jgi:molybdopterin-guanine dinucleotide biosynthesis protein A
VLPPLADDLTDKIEIVEDSVAGAGPLQGLRDGLRAVGDRADVAFVAATDLPLLRPELVRAVLDAVVDVEVALPVSGGPHPLAAAYRTSLVPLIDELLASGERRVGALLERCSLRELDEEALRAVDPALDSLVNVNSAADLAALDRR